MGLFAAATMAISPLMGAQGMEQPRPQMSQAMPATDRMLQPYEDAANGSNKFASLFDVIGGQGQPDIGAAMPVSQGQLAPVAMAGPDNTDTSHWEDVARRMAANQYGWGPDQFKYLDWTISGGGPANVVAESRWDPSAVNPAGAYGIPQMYAPAHPEVNVQQFMQHPRQQIEWLLNYVHDRYGGPQGAYQAKAGPGGSY